jgi:hypothetical protein
MCNVASTPPRTANLSTTDTSNYGFVAVGDVRPAAGLDSVSFDVNLMVANNLSVKPGLLWFATRATHPDNSVDTVTTGGYATSQGRYVYQQDLSGTTNKFCVAPVLTYKASSGLGSGMARVQATWKSSGVPLGARDVVVHPSTEGTDKMYFPLTGWHSTLGVDTIMASIIAMDVNNGYVQDRLAIRTALEPSEPNSIVDCESGWNTPGAGNSARNTGLVSVPAGANLSTNNVFQLMLAVRKSDAGQNNARAYYRVASAVVLS